jgi:Lon protease-like protein
VAGDGGSSQMSVRLAMFPLGSVLVPHALVPLHIFEPRYRVLMFDCTRGDPTFGVVLIERGSEVGGHDQRFAVGTVARIVEAEELADGRWVVVVVGTQRIRVLDWLADDPYPVAMVDQVAEPPWSSSAAAARGRAEASVRQSLAMAAELRRRIERAGDPLARLTGPAADRPAGPGERAGLELSDDPQVAVWQLVAAAPLAIVDKQRLLEVEDHADRLRQLDELAADQAAMFAYRLSNE